MLTTIQSTLLTSSTFVRILPLFALVFMAQNCLAQDKTDKTDKTSSPPAFMLNIITIFPDGEKVMTVRQVQTEGEPVTQSYTVSIPYVENGVTKFQKEERTRTVKPTKMVLAPVHEGTYFQDLNGKELDTKAIAEKTPKTGRQVIVLPDNKQEIPKEWKELFKEHVVIMRTPIQH